ncbi:hypothetical protein J5N97_006293 [Dioscorea zingiberensis]|uniref:Uncharacterized protein n=1 Tax=Dioscorea zingiberensis TaxID=325984 RepID=A0A9D5DCS9_9LILI|nr:hypothetical protein J5N97_006293 [Dioscorea zingiberensis]
MASGIVLSFRPTGIRACAVAGEERRQQRSPGRSCGGGGGAGWWAPLFGWTAEPDYIEDGERGAGGGEEEGSGSKPVRRFAAFTEEKARELRMRTRETESFHDVMYHSAIASRLATDGPRRS